VILSYLNKLSQVAFVFKLVGRHRSCRPPPPVVIFL